MAYLYPIATAVPAVAYEQNIVADLMQAQLTHDRRLQRLCRGIYRHSGIARRHSVIRDLAGDAEGGAFFGPDGTLKRPGTAHRNETYTREAKGLFATAARRALYCAGLEPSTVTHVVTASCTGFFAPGPDYHLVRALALRPSVGRFHIGFMGCYAAFPALRLAQALCQAEPDATVLVAAAELCTLHLQPAETLDDLIAASVFADGAAAAVVSARTPDAARPALSLDAFATTLTEEGEVDMAWTIGDTGFNMVLSSYVPDLLEANIERAVAPLLDAAGVGQDAIDHWAVHPGGRAILDKVESGLGLNPDALVASREVLRDYGNMSSATVLFVLEQVQKRAGPGDTVAALAFGPGLTVEGGLFRRV